MTKDDVIALCNELIDDQVNEYNEYYKLYGIHPGSRSYDRGFIEALTRLQSKLHE